MNILVIDGSNHNITELRNLLTPKFCVDNVITGAEGVSKAAKRKYDLILIGSYIPDIDYVNLTDQIRSEGVNTPILITSSPGLKNKALSALHAGADNFIEKPVCGDELNAKISAILRRTISSISKTLFKVGNLELDIKTMQVRRNGEDIQLRKIEFRILEYFVRHEGDVVYRNDLYDYVWNGKGHVGSKISVHIKYLRDKIDEPYGGNLLKTVRGYGYKLSAD